MNKYQALFRIRFTNSLQYRSAAFAGMVTQFVWGMLEIFAFRAFYQTDPAAFPMTFSNGPFSKPSLMSGCSKLS